MPFQMDGQTFQDHAAGVAHIKKTKPEIKDPDAYIATIERQQETLELVAEPGLEMMESQDPRGDGAVLDEHGQPNVIDYSNKEPLLFQIGEDNVSKDYPGKIITSNEPSKDSPDRQVKHDTDHAETGKYSIDLTEPTISTGYPTGDQYKPLGVSVGRPTQDQGSGYNMTYHPGQMLELDETFSMGAGVVARDVGGPGCKKCKLQEVVERCGGCANYRLDNQCSLVMGDIDPDNGLCKLWEAATKKPTHFQGIEVPEITKTDAGYFEINPLLQESFVEEDHPRAPAGSAEGGQFVSKDSAATPGGLELNTEEEPNLSPGVMGYEPDKFSDEQLQKELKFYQNSIGNYRQGSPIWIQMSGKLGAIKAEIAKRSETPGDQVPAEEPKKPEEEKKPEQSTTQQSDHKKGSEIYSNTPKGDTDQDKAARLKMWKDTEGDNESVAVMRDQIIDYEGRIERKQEWADDHLKRGMLSQEVYDDEIKTIEQMKRDLASFKDQKQYFEQKLGDKLEPVEVQKLLQQRTRFQQDQARRKKNSGPWSADQVQIHYIERQIDRFRSGNRTGSNQSEWDEKVRVATEEADKRYEEQRRIREEKEKKKTEKVGKDEKNAIDTFKSLGIDIGQYKLSGDQIDNAIADLHPRQDMIEKAKTDPAAHKQVIEQNINYNKAMAAYYTLKITQQQKEGIYGYVSDRFKRAHENFKFRANNEIVDNPVLGTHVYSDVKDKEKMESHFKKLADVPPYTRSLMQHVEIHENGARESFKAAGGKKCKAAGVWKKYDKTAVMYYNGKKWDEEYGGKQFGEAFGTTPDHEYAHATYDAVQSWLTLNNDADFDTKSKVSIPFDNFNTVAEETGHKRYSTDDGPQRFRLDPYTDSYYIKQDERRHTETHSKLREFEVNGEMEKLERDANLAIEYAEDFAKDPEKYYAQPKRISSNFNPAYYQPDTIAKDKYGFINVEHARDTLKLINSYKKLREAEYELK